MTIMIHDDCGSLIIIVCNQWVDHRQIEEKNMILKRKGQNRLISKITLHIVNKWYLSSTWREDIHNILTKRKRTILVIRLIDAENSRGNNWANHPSSIPSRSLAKMTIEHLFFIYIAKNIWYKIRKKRLYWWLIFFILLLSIFFFSVLTLRSFYSTSNQVWRIFVYSHFNICILTILTVKVYCA